MTDVTKEGARARAIALQSRLAESSHQTLKRTGRSATALHLRSEIRNYLLKASSSKAISDPPFLIHKQLVISPGGEASSYSIAVCEKYDRTHAQNFKRDRTLPHFNRPDGAWFDFQLTVREEPGELSVIAYDFELRLDSDYLSPFKFIRFDLNPPKHGNNDRGMRSHLHLGTDDDGYLAPAPVMSPFEILDLFLHGLAPAGRKRESSVR